MADHGPLVVLLTDFGWADPYVGVMKGVLLSLIPEARTIDLTHAVPPQNIRNGAFQLMVSTPFFPANTFFICVVDPGVGSERKIIYAEAGKQKFIGPDNGLLSWNLRRSKPDLLVEIIRGPKADKEVSKTFHGRDIFTPVAAHILLGEPPTSFGPAMENWTELPFPQVEKAGSKWTGEILAIDGFGNLITNFQVDEVVPLAKSSKVWMKFGDSPVTIRGFAETYVSVEKGKFLAIGGSAGFLEICVRDGNAAKKTGLRERDKISLHFRT